MKYMIRDLIKNKAVPALLSIALGIVIIIARRATLDLLVKIIGGLVITCGVGFVVAYLTRSDPDAGNLKMILILAGTAMLIGILLISFAQAVVDFFPTLMGILLILNGLSHLTEASVDSQNRIVVGIMGILVILLGILIVARPGAIADMVMIFIGASFIINGIMDLVMVNRIIGRSSRF